MNMKLIRVDFISKLADSGVFWPHEPQIHKKKNLITHVLCVYMVIYW